MITSIAVQILAQYIARTFCVRLEDIKTFEVWHSYILGNQKWLYGAVVNGKMTPRYYELTYNAAKNQLYIDRYVKEENKCFDFNK